MAEQTQDAEAQRLQRERQQVAETELLVVAASSEGGRGPTPILLAETLPSDTPLVETPPHKSVLSEEDTPSDSAESNETAEAQVDEHETQAAAATSDPPADVNAANVEPSAGASND